MRTEQIKSEIDKLALSEKLLLVEDLWDSIAASNSEITLPEWQKEELDRRYKEYQKGNLALHDWQSVHENYVSSRASETSGNRSGCSIISSVKSTSKSGHQK